ncbi:MAG: VCBS repeat-containing protein, partial [Bacteroidota bacterium]
MDIQLHCRHIKFLAGLLALLVLGLSCQSTAPETTEVEAPKALNFESTQIGDSLELIWAHCPADITGDGIADLVFVDNNGYGGRLYYLQGQTTPGIWKKKIIAAEAPRGGTFAQGDLECADMDFDGDIDIVVAKHTGEWEASTDNSSIYWLENPSWEPHFIGEAPDFIKDFNLVDFNKDQKMDVAVMTFETNTFSIFQQNDKDTWERVQHYPSYQNLHEGMAAGDIDGDGWIDLVANAHIFYNPGKDLTQNWREENLDKKWNQQTGDWSRNGTKAFIKDLNGDGKAEIFVSHSERSGFPLSYYQRNDDNTWSETQIIDSIPAC